MIGPLAIGDRVVVNVTGIALDLGTGGEGFVLWNLDGPGPPEVLEGHIVKLRYTPWQIDVLASESPESPHHDRLAGVTSIDGMPVVVCSLHSQIAGVAAGIKAAAPDARVGYLMTDGAALPLSWSDLVETLVQGSLIDDTCTSGHAFGGSLEAVNVFSGLAALKHVAHSDVAIAAMGPGVVGTSTALGFTGMEQGQLLDAATALGGRAVACLRISFADDRPRHRGISHHSLSALRIAAREPCTIAVPYLPDDRAAYVEEQIEEEGLGDRHSLVRADPAPGLRLLLETVPDIHSMGRSVDETPELFAAATAAGAVAAERL
jgi:hypothetical protein